MLLFFLLSAALVAADQITKALAVAYLKPVTTVPIIRDVLHLTYRENTGAAFSILSGFRWGFVILAVIVCAAVIYINASRKIDSKMFYASSILVVAGAIGNVIDRIATGAVVDFIDFRLIDFPVFNFADICLTVGVAMLFIYFLFFYGKEKKTVKTEETPDEDNGN
ncbi:MAG: signal peptidase II [Clostridia bacterium]|nr:signal peptidase II [Clostridia bacterium]